MERLADSSQTPRYVPKVPNPEVIHEFSAYTRCRVRGIDRRWRRCHLLSDGSTFTRILIRLPTRGTANDRVRDQEYLRLKVLTCMLPAL
jgi:hypothetical protein